MGSDFARYASFVEPAFARRCLADTSARCRRADLEPKLGEAERRLAGRQGFPRIPFVLSPRFTFGREIFHPVRVRPELLFRPLASVCRLLRPVPARCHSKCHSRRAPFRKLSSKGAECALLNAKASGRSIRPAPLRGRCKQRRWSLLANCLSPVRHRGSWRGERRPSHRRPLPARQTAAA